MHIDRAEAGGASGVRSALLIGGSFAAVVLIGVLDYFSGPDVSLSLLHLAPVMIVAWYAATIAAVCVSVAGALTWFVAETMAGRQFAHPAIGAWDAVVLLGFLMTAAFLMSALRNAFDRERNSARLDALTGIPNSRAFHEIAEAELRRARRFNRPLTVAYLDLDNFKAVNDKEGHAAGDRLLRTAAGEMRRLVRAVDLVARLGGDEFALLLPETDPGQARTVIDKISTGITQVGGMRGVTMSIGVMTYFTPPSGVDEMLKDADDLMYAAKTAGKAGARFDVVN